MHQMRFFLILIFLFSQLAFANEAIDVSVVEPIDGRLEFEVRQSARLKAQQEALPRLPLVISGLERLKDENYTQEIKALSVAYLNVNITKEVWDRENNAYTLDAEVSLDDTVTEQMLGSVRDSEILQKKLRAAYEEIELLSKNYTREGFMKSHAKILSVIEDKSTHDNIKDILAAKQRAEERASRIFLDEYMVMPEHAVTISAYDVDEDRIYLEANVTEEFKAQLESAAQFARQNIRQSEIAFEFDIYEKSTLDHKGTIAYLSLNHDVIISKFSRVKRDREKISTSKLTYADLYIRESLKFTASHSMNDDFLSRPGDFYEFQLSIVLEPDKTKEYW